MKKYPIWAFLKNLCSKLSLFSAIKTGWSFRPTLDRPRGRRKMVGFEPSAGGLVWVRSHILLSRRWVLNYAFWSLLLLGPLRCARLALAQRGACWLSQGLRALVLVPQKAPARPETRPKSIRGPGG